MVSIPGGGDSTTLYSKLPTHTTQESTFPTSCKGMAEQSRAQAVPRKVESTPGHLLRDSAYLDPSFSFPISVQSLESSHFHTIHKGAINYLRGGNTAFIPSDSPSITSLFSERTRGPDSLSREM